MKHVKPGVVFLFLLFVPALCLGGQSDLSPVRRFGIFIGANDGGPQRETLRWAVSDAKSMQSVLSEYGGIHPRDTLLLEDPGLAMVTERFRELSSLLQEAKSSSRRVELLVYYSGHSDEQGLMLGSEHLEYRQLRNLIGQAQADVSIAILDSCASGAFTRTKGGVRIAPFLVDDSADMSGHAYLTSASETEAAQESDRIGASFFTHFMVTGLRGAADHSNDGRVTLNEAYEYAFSETLNQTQSTYAGPQHPSYDIQLNGSGDLVLSDLTAASSALTLPRDLEGRVYIRTAEHRLIAEVAKAPGRPVTIGLAPGIYTISVTNPDGLLSTSTRVGMSGPTMLLREDFRTGTLEYARVRGEVQRSLDPSLPSVPGEPVYLPVYPSIWPGFSLFGLHDPVVTSFSISPLLADASQVAGLQVGGIAGFTGTLYGLQVGGIFAQGKTINGLQIGGIFATADQVNGSQIGGIFTRAEDVKGVQIAGITAVSRGDVRGAQISPVNVAQGTVYGSQIGVVNIAHDMYGLPIGLFSWIKNGIHDIAFWFTGEEEGWVGFLNGSRNFYTSFAAGVQTEPGIAELEGLTVSASVGYRVSLGSLFFIDAELGLKRLGTGATAGERLAGIFTGPGSNTFPNARLRAGISLGSLKGFVGLDVDGYIQGYTNPDIFTNRDLSPEDEEFILSPRALIGFSFL